VGQAVVFEPERVRARAIPFRTGTAPWGPAGAGDRDIRAARSSSRSDVRNSRTVLRSDSAISGRVVVCMGTSDQFIITDENRATGHGVPQRKGGPSKRSIAGDSTEEDRRQATVGPEGRFLANPRRGRGVLGGRTRECWDRGRRVVRGVSTLRQIRQSRKNRE
jgi:hypothetical protein